MVTQDHDSDATLATLSIPEIASLLAGKNLWHTASIPSKGIKSVRVSDGPNGVRGIKTINGSGTTAFPCATALASTWNASLIYEVGREMAGQAISKGVSVILAPTVNIHRSPLGGRSFECFSEDPVLSGKLAASLVQGVQDQGVGACVKHFVCNDQETDRNKVDTIVDERTLREIYLKPFQIVVREAKPWAIMAAYNRVNGIHVSENKRLLEDVLRTEWGWNGCIMSDWFGVYSSAEALNAGLDLEMPGPTVWRSDAQLMRNVAAGKVSISTMYARAKNILTLTDRLKGAGIGESAIEKENNTPQSQQINLNAAQEAIVLLKNESGVLPLKSCKSIAVIGPNAKRDLSTGGGSASLRQYYYVSAFEGIRNASQKHSDDTEVSFSQGCFTHEMLPLFSGYTSLGTSGLEVEFFAGDFTSPGDVQASFTTTSAQMIFMDSLSSDITLPAHGRVRSTFTPETDAVWEFSLVTIGRARLFVDGQQVVSNWDKQEPSSKYFGLAAKEIKGSLALRRATAYNILIEYSSSIPTRESQPNPFGAGILRIGALPVLDADQLMRDAIEAASKADVVILCLGTDQERESEGYDRSDISLGGRQNELAELILAANPNTVVVNFSGSPIEMPWASKAPAIIQAWFLGSELGNAVGSVLFGDFNPGGKLPVSFPVRLEDTPSYGNFPGEKAVVKYAEGIQVGYRHYTTENVTTAFPFGHGLSYTTFTYSNLRAEQWELSTDQILNIHMDVTNTGGCAGSEVIQLFIAPLDAPVKRPKRELAAFAKVVDLAPGVSQTVDLAVDKYSLSYYDDSNSTWVLAKGNYTVEIGASSENIVLEHVLEVKEPSTWTGV